MALTCLLTSVLPAFICGVINPNGDFIFAVNKSICNVKAEGTVATDVTANFLFVYVNLAFPVNCTKMENCSLTFERLGKCNLFSVSHTVSFGNSLAKT